MVKEDPKQKARWDVDTLIRAQEIMNDPKRKKFALAEIAKRREATDKAEATLENKTQKRLGKVFGE